VILIVDHFLSGLGSDLCNVEFAADKCNLPPSAVDPRIDAGRHQRSSQSGAELHNVRVSAGWTSCR
jgi:hypothetical protein